MNRYLASCAAVLPVFWAGTASASYLNLFNPATGHYYSLSQQPEFFLNARAEAASLGTYLATINDASENQWVLSNFGGLPELAGDQRLWIGLTDEVNEGTFVWDNGEPFLYSNWVPGEPNNTAPITDYAEIIVHHPDQVSSGKWNDNANEALNWALIESTSPVVPEPSSLVLAGSGLIAFVFYARRRRK